MHPEADDRIGRRRLRRRVQPAERGGAATDQLPDIVLVRRRVRLRPGYGDADDVVADGQVDVGPTKRRHLAATQGPVENQRDDRAVDQAAAQRRVIALDAAAGAARAATHSEDAVALFGGEASRRTAAGGGPGGAAETLEGLPGQRAIRRARAGGAGGAPHGGEHDGGGRRGAARRAQAVEIRGQSPVVEGAAGEPSLEPAAGGDVGVAGRRGGGPFVAAGRSPGAGRVYSFIGSGRGRVFRTRELFPALLARALECPERPEHRRVGRPRPLGNGWAAVVSGDSRPVIGEAVALLLRCSGEWRDYIVTGVVDGRAGSWQVRTRPLGKGDEVRPMCITGVCLAR